MITTDLHSTRHFKDGKPMYDRSFDNVMSFHDGIAAVKDSSGAYHIDMNGWPIYTERFSESYGYYCDVAAVKDSSGAYHIDRNGKPIYNQKYAWVGNFQENFCTVRRKDGKYTYIDLSGEELEEKYDYAGDFQNGIAVIRVDGKGCTHIKTDGTNLHNIWFLDCGNYSEDSAIVSDLRGDYLVDTDGNSLFTERYDSISKKTNGLYLARKENMMGQLSKNWEWNPLYRIPDKPENDKIPKWVEDISTHEWDACLIFIRHSRRFPNFVFNVTASVRKGLARSGEEYARFIGKEFFKNGIKIDTVLSSPIPRCEATARLISSEAGYAGDVQLTTILGDPGTAFIYDTNKSNEMLNRPFPPQIIDHLSGKSIGGWYSAGESISKLVAELRKYLTDKKVTLCISHDGFVALFLGVLSKIFPGGRWIDYCEGGLLIRRGTEYFLIWNGKEYRVPDQIDGKCEILSPKSSGKLICEDLTVDPLASKISGKKLKWSSVFQDNVCAVCDESGKFHHIRADGLPIHVETYDMVDDFKYNISTASRDGVGSTHISDTGESINHKWFLECEPYHKGYAAVRDEKGWFHINLDGNPLYDERYDSVEPFYNNVSLCRKGSRLMLRNTGGEEETIVYKTVLN